MKEGERERERVYPVYCNTRDTQSLNKESSPQDTGMHSFSVTDC